MLTKWRRWARPKNYNAGSVPEAFVIVSGVLLFPVIVFLLLHFCWRTLFDCTRTDLWMWSCQMGSADIRLSFVLYNMAVKNTNQRLSLTLIIQPFVFVSIDFVFVLTVFYCINCICISINCISYCTNVEVVREEHKRGSLPRTNNSTTIIHLKLGYTLNPRAGCEQFDI